MARLNRITPEQQKKILEKYSGISKLTAKDFLMDALSVAPALLGMPQGVIVPYGIDKYLSPTVMRRVRKTMAQEFKSRGKPLMASIRPELKAVMKNPTPERVVDEIIRGPWFHGRGTYPFTGETFKYSRTGHGNIGEPHGLSLTADKNLLKQQFAKQMSEVDKYGNPGFARVLPMIKGRPVEKILAAWKGKGTEKSQDILKKAYIQSLPRDVKFDLTKDIGKLEHSGTNPNIRDRLLRNLGYDDDIDLMVPREKSFNLRISDNLKKRGYKGLLYSPHRFNEYELKMLDPSDVMMLDIRKQTDPGLERMFKKGNIELDKSKAIGQHVHDLKGLIQYAKNMHDTATSYTVKKAALKKLHSFQGELDNYLKDNIGELNLVAKPGRQVRKLTRWEKVGAPRDKSSLGTIYKDMDWEDVYKAFREESF